MSKVKTKVNVKVVQDYLRKNLDDKCTNCVALKGGEASQAFSFNSKGKNLVMRVTSKEYNCFLKDKYAYDNFLEYRVPIPKIVELGTLDKYFYAISEQALGKALDKFTGREINKLMPNIVKVLISIQSVKLVDKSGFGDWNSEGVAKDKSWKEVILGYFRRMDEKWDNKYGATFFEKDLFNQMKEELDGIIDSLINYRYLVHGDYGFENIISDGKRITGVIDWEYSMYGDFLYDVAWLEFWASKNGYAKICKDHYQKNKENIDNWNNRILSCIYYFGVGSLDFFAVSGQQRKYNWVKDRLLHIVKNKHI